MQKRSGQLTVTDGDLFWVRNQVLERSFCGFESRTVELIRSVILADEWRRVTRLTSTSA
ncbi:hypothetical protein G6M89_14230 [Natronolimnobius sp. AArcel1]|uniref:hypothetical protein n=1 Tax=Natronolimnobius sp. AArcel1 TaxID=1679093 RepID=UPI0013EB1DFF|nr:hypothetical protein [Natronolimnobius sp. AArcel1]NGM70151.1 hypothetical protein [Natronolimnobius sp. AArcel1]